MVDTDRCYSAPFPMPEAEPRSSTRLLYLYFSLLALLVNVTSPQWVLDIPTSYMLKDLLHATASEVSWFRLITGIPLYAGFVFGLAAIHGTRLAGGIRAIFASSYPLR